MRISAATAPILAAWLLTPSVAEGHFRLVDPSPRSDQSGITMGPCGGDGPASPVASYTAGGRATIAWSVEQEHGGSFRVSLSYDGDEGFEDNVLVDGIAEGQSSYSETVTFPDRECERCTLQVAQVTAGGSAGYFSCADIELTPGEGGCSVGQRRTSAGALLGLLVVAVWRRRRSHQA